MTDAELVDRCARDFIRWHGSASVGVLREQGEIAESNGDTESCDAWHDIADAAERLLKAPAANDRAEAGLRAEARNSSIGADTCRRRLGIRSRLD